MPMPMLAVSRRTLSPMRLGAAKAMIGGAAGVAGLRDLSQQDLELVAPIPTDGVGISHSPHKAMRHELQYLVANVMPQGVVDLLEVD
jgi:hypothetical protein